MPAPPEPHESFARQVVKPWLWVLAGGLMLFSIVIGIKPLILLAWPYYSFDDPKDRESFRKWMHEPVAIAPDLLADADPFTTETIAAARDFRVVASTLPDNLDTTLNLMLDRAFAGQLTSDSTLTRYAPVLEAYQKVVARPDYEMAAFMADAIILDDVMPTSNFSTNYYMDCSRLQAINVLLPKSGRTEVLQNKDIELLLKTFRCNPHDGLMVQLVSITQLSLASRAISQAHNVLDISAMQKLNDLLKAINPHDYYADESATFPFSDVQFAIRELKRRGVDVRMKERYSGYELYELQNSIQAIYLERLIGGSLLSATEEREARRVASRVGKRSRAMEQALPGLDLGEALFAIETEYSIQYLDWADVFARRSAALARFNSLRLEVAIRLYSLEHGRKPANLEELMPNYIVAIPADPFDKSGAPMRFLNGKSYSIGPNQVDQAMSVPYDPTNGTTSLGDIFLAPTPRHAAGNH